MKVVRIIGFIICAALLAGGIYIYQKSKSLDVPEFVRLENIKFKNITAPPNLKITFTSNAIINNPMPHELQIVKVDFDIMVDGKKTGHITQEVETVMPANAEFALPLSYEVPIGEKEFFKNFKNMLNGAWKKQSIKIRSLGTITIRAARLDFDIPFDYDDEYKLEDYL